MRSQLAINRNYYGSKEKESSKEEAPLKCFRASLRVILSIEKPLIHFSGFSYVFVLVWSHVFTVKALWGEGRCPYL